MGKKVGSLSLKNWVLIWTLGIAGQICWNIENSWFNTYIYENIAPDSTIITWMVACSAIATTVSTFVIGTLSDRIGKRKPFISIGYILWGVFTIAYGLVGYTGKFASLTTVAIMIVCADLVMSFFGSMGNDSGFNTWITDILNDNNKGQLGAALATQPVIGTILGTVIGGIVIASSGYVAFFGIMGGLVIVIGIVSAFILKDSPDIKPHKDGSFMHQVLSAFSFRRFAQNKELVLVFLCMCIYFTSFNVYFTYIGTYMIYTLGFSEAVAGYIQGAGLIIAVLFTIPAVSLVNKNKLPELSFTAIIIEIIGLICMWKFSVNVDSTTFWNPLLIVSIILVGIGYVIILQTFTVWGKELYPEEARGNIEGVRIVFWVLIPMIIGPAIANPLIKANGKVYISEYASGVIEGRVPGSDIFFAAMLVLLLAFVPWFFASKLHRRRCKK